MPALLRQGNFDRPAKEGLPPARPLIPFAQQRVLARIEGVVVLECLISPNGRVREVKVLRSVPLLEEAAVEAVKQWVYTPTLMDGVPVPVLITVTVRFDLRDVP